MAKSPFKLKCDSITYHTQETPKSSATITNHKLEATNVQNKLNAVGDEMPDIDPIDVCSVTPGPDCNGDKLTVGGVKKLLYKVNINKNNFYIRSTSFYNAANDVYTNYKTRNKANLITVSNSNKSILFKGLTNKQIKYLYKN